MTMTGTTVRLAALACRRLDFPGRWRVVPLTIEHVRRVGAGMRATTVGTRHGFRIHCHLDDWIGQHVFVTGSYEESTAALMAALVGSGDTVIDVGANIGFFTLLLSRLVGPRGRVVACEPMPLALTRLRRNLDINRSENVTIEPVAASCSIGEATFFLGPSDHTSISSLIPREGAPEVRVPLRTLDDIIGDATVTLIKVDVEGAEADVLAGATGLLARGVRDIIVEVNGPRVPALLTESGYRMYVIDWDALRPVSNVNSLIDRPQYNALFTTRASLPPSVPLEPAS